MRLSKHLAATLAGLSLGLVLGGWSAAALGAEEGAATSAAPATAPPAPTGQTTAVEQPAAQQAPRSEQQVAEQSAAPQAAAEQPTSEPPAARGPSAATTSTPAAEPATTTGESEDLWYPPVAPPSLQTLVDQRRDMIRKRREAMYGGYGYMPPGWADYRFGMDRYRDAMRALYRQQRDYSRQHHRSWLDAFCPWSKPERDWNEMRGYATQMDQLDWQEYRNAYPYGRPWGYGAPIPW